MISQFPKFPKFLPSLGWATIPCLNFILLADGGVCGLLLKRRHLASREGKLSEQLPTRMRRPG